MFGTDVKLKKCKCGADVMNTAKVCPQCGAKLKMGIVRKILIGFGVIVVIFALIGSIGSDTTSPSAPVATAIKAPEKTAEQITQEKADTELKAKQAEEAKVAADKAAAEAKIASLKNEAKTVPYKDIARTPDAYMGAKVKYTGEVLQVQEDGNTVGLRVNVTKNSYGYENTMFVAYDKGIVSGRVLEDDIITFWGNSMGLLTYKTVMGAEMTIPKVLAQIVEVN
jgi:phosphopantetheinyl transferase (holo-ACP synthase)